MTETPATFGSDSDLELHDGFQGLWLRTGVAEAFVALEPVFRILALRSPGGSSLLADSASEQCGLRLAFMEPEQTSESFRVGEQPARIIERAEARVRVRLARACGLRYEAAISLEPGRPVLRLDCRLVNVGTRYRRVACWSLLSFRRDGAILVPFGDASDAPSRFVRPSWTEWPQPGLAFGEKALLASLGGAMRGDFLKVGVITEPGWGAFLRSTEALVSHAPFDPAASYPEGGANVTFFESRERNPGWAECECVGPLRRLAPGEETRFSESLELITFPQPLSAEPDALRAAIDLARLPKV